MISTYTRLYIACWARDNGYFIHIKFVIVKSSYLYFLHFTSHVMQIVPIFNLF